MIHYEKYYQKLHTCTSTFDIISHNINICLNALQLEQIKTLMSNFNAFHTVVLKINLLVTVKHNKYIGPDYGMSYIKFNKTTCFGQLRPSSGP